MAVSIEHKDCTPVVTISLAELQEHLRASERIAAVERYCAANTYLNGNDIMAILGIRKENEDEHI